MTKVTAAILIKDGKILIAKRKGGDHQANKWEFPGGKVKQNETPQACLKREMQEEFGINISVGRIFGESIYHYDYGSIKLRAYLASLESGKLTPKAHSEFRWISRDQLSEYDFAPADIPFVKKLQNPEFAPPINAAPSLPGDF
jgi:8-oxo-dGTP diphosphatase